MTRAEAKARFLSFCYGGNLTDAEKKEALELYQALYPKAIPVMTQQQLIETALSNTQTAVDILNGILPSDGLHLGEYTDVHRALRCLYAATTCVQTLERWRSGVRPVEPREDKVSLDELV